MTAKRLELLKEAISKVTRVAFLADRNAGGYKETKQAAATAARSLGMQLQVHEVGGPGDLNGAFASMRRQGAGAILVPVGTMLFANRVQVAEQTQKTRLPTMCGEREHANAGCLISYGPRIRDVFRGAANLVGGGSADGRPSVTRSPDPPAPAPMAESPVRSPWRF